MAMTDKNTKKLANLYLVFFIIILQIDLLLKIEWLSKFWILGIAIHSHSANVQDPQDEHETLVTLN